MPLEIRTEEAMRKAVANVIADHRRTGDPIVIWHNGKVVKIPADQIEVHEPETEYGTPNPLSRPPSERPD